MIKEQLVKIGGKTFKELGYDFKDETYCLYEKIIPVRTNFLDDIFAEFISLIDSNIHECIERSLEISHN